MKTNPLRTGKPYSLINAGRDVVTSPSVESYFIDGYTVSVSRVSNGYKGWVNLGEPFYIVEAYNSDIQTVIERVAERCNRLKRESDETYRPDTFGRAA